MKFSDIELPSNRTFGFFFTLVFATGAAYSYHSANVILAYIFTVIASLLFVITMIKRDLLLPLNKVWMSFGLVLGLLVSPMILGIIFFFLFTPLALVMRLCGRDELRLKFTHKPSHWILRNEVIESGSFKNQF